MFIFLFDDVKASYKDISCNAFIFRINKVEQKLKTNVSIYQHISSIKNRGYHLKSKSRYSISVEPKR